MSPHAQGSEEIYDLAGRFLRVLRILGEIIQYPESEQDIEHLDLNQLRVIHLLRDKPELSQEEIAESLGLEPSRLSAILQKLLGIRLVRYQPEKRDGLIFRYYLTLIGQKLAFNAEAMQIVAAARFLKVLPLEDQQAVIGILERMITGHHPD
ncbi:MAG TPA: MarR family winged helix-turn-helix transcriptional regulator [Bellilinea sp.]|nr:MarR family winged helix-turn-helix transcriptional regulator [Bellilinea sp.]